MPTDADLRKRLTPIAYHVTRENGTERAFTGALWDNHEEGAYACVVCGAALFDSAHKFDSGTGWPSYWRAAEGAPVEERVDTSHGMRRVEVRCKSCDSHLGHVFDDGPRPTGQRYCINSAALEFKRR